MPHYEGFIYPYLNDSDLAKASMGADYGMPSNQYLPPESTSSSSQQAVIASGGPGGNPGVWEPVITVSANITNTGRIAGHEAVQFMLALEVTNHLGF